MTRVRTCLPAGRDGGGAKPRQPCDAGTNHEVCLYYLTRCIQTTILCLHLKKDANKHENLQNRHKYTAKGGF